VNTPAAPLDPPGTGPTGAGRARGWPWAEVPFPLALVGLGVFTVVDATTIRVPGSTNIIGPRAFPYAIGALLVVTGLAVLAGLARGHRGEAEGGEDVDTDRGTDWGRVALLVGSLLALVVLIEPLGWPIAATVLFGGAAWSLGARPLWRPLLVGAVLAVVTQIVFTQALDVFLPAGPFEGVAFFG
jgi:putative tricarboxylic transport membrane protein